MTQARPAPEGARSILKAAAELFAREGFEPVSVSQIAEHAGVCKANVFHHFDSKESLFMAVMREVSAEHAEWAEALLDQPGTCAERLRKLVRYEIETMFAHEQRTRLILRESVDHGHCLGRKMAQEVFQRNFSVVVALFEQGRRLGEFSEDFDPAVAALTFRGALSLYFQYGDGIRLSPEARHLKSARDYADRVCAILLDGVVAPARKTRKGKTSA